MPYKFQTDHVLLPREKDRRIKLTLAQREEIKTSDMPSRKLAELYGVSRRTIQFIKDPEKLVENRLARDLRGGWRQYYDKDKHKDYTKGHRRYKQGLKIEGGL